MSDGMEFDFSEIDMLGVSIDEARQGVRGKLRSAVEITARNVKDSWRDKLEGSHTLPALPHAVTYDVDRNTIFGVDVVRAEIGFDKHRNQGPLGNISEFGTPSTPPRGYGHGALEENQADFERGIEIALDQSLREAGL